MIWVLADSALEHFSHGWQDLVRRGVVEVTDPDAFPPQVSDVVGTAGYHLAVVAQYLKTILDESRGDKSEGRLTVSHWICRWCGHVWADINLPVANAEMLMPPGVPCPDCAQWQLEPYIFEVDAPAGGIDTR